MSKPKARRRKKTSTGRITTFYSYKGGSGRTMVLANVAWTLAAAGKRVLAMDWDMEAPGLHRYFHPFLSDPLQGTSPGLLDRLLAYQQQAGEDSALALADLSEVLQPVGLPKVAKGSLHFVGTGRQDEGYAERLGGFDWSRFYTEAAGAEFIDALGAWARSRFDVVLIDSRTGVADSAGVCTVQLPDQVLLCFIYNRQNIEGTAAVARSIAAQCKAVGRTVSLFPLPTRVEDKDAVAGARRYAAELFDDVFPTGPGGMERLLRVNEIRHYPWCAYGERLAALNDDPEESGSLLRDMHALTTRLFGDEPALVGVPDPEERARLWRRAAFSDPRLAELEQLGAVEPEEALAKVRAWLDEAEQDEHLREDWIFRLAHALYFLPEEQVSETNMLGGRALALCRPFAEKAPSRLGGRMADLLRNQCIYHTDESEMLSILDEALNWAALDRKGIKRRVRGLEARRALTLIAIGRFEDAKNAADLATGWLDCKSESDAMDLIIALYAAANTKSMVGDVEGYVQAADRALHLYLAYPGLKSFGPAVLVRAAHAKTLAGDFEGSLEIIRRARKEEWDSPVRESFFRELAVLEAGSLAGLGDLNQAKAVALSALAEIQTEPEKQELQTLLNEIEEKLNPPDKTNALKEALANLDPDELENLMADVTAMKSSRTTQ